MRKQCLLTAPYSPKYIVEQQYAFVFLFLPFQNIPTCPPVSRHAFLIQTDFGTGSLSAFFTYTYPNKLRNLRVIDRFFFTVDSRVSLSGFVF
jgi:hypothetical protein